MDGDYLYFRQTVRFTEQHDLENGTIYVSMSYHIREHYTRTSIERVLNVSHSSWRTNTSVTG